MMNAGHRAVDDVLVQRAYSEFMEMPGLQLTGRQAQRLWGLDEGTCLQLLDFLVDTKFLCQPGQGTYARRSDGRDERPSPRSAHAPGNTDAPQRGLESV